MIKRVYYFCENIYAIPIVFGRKKYWNITTKKHIQSENARIYIFYICFTVDLMVILFLILLPRFLSQYDDIDVYVTYRPTVIDFRLLFSILSTVHHSWIKHFRIHIGNVMKWIFPILYDEKWKTLVIIQPICEG